MKVYLKTKLNALKKYEFDLTTLGFNYQNSPVPSRSLNRVPTVLWESMALSLGQIKTNEAEIQSRFPIDFN